MAAGTPFSRLQRLDQLRGLLRARAHATAGMLAEELGVSRRTLHRDLSLLRDSGLPIEAERGRGGGMRLDPRYSLSRIEFTAAEAIDMLLSIAIAEQLNSPVLLRHLGPVRRKIVAAFGERHQKRIRALRERILIGPPASASVTSTRRPSAPALDALAGAFLNAQSVTIEYVANNGNLTVREVEPHFLFLTAPVWYLLCWDRLRGAIRHFRVDRVRSVRDIGQSFVVGEARVYATDIEMKLTQL